MKAVLIELAPAAASIAVLVAVVAYTAVEFPFRVPCAYLRHWRWRFACKRAGIKVPPCG